MKKRIIIIEIVLLFIISLTSISYAASASISASSQNVTTGTPVTITGSVTAGGWNLKLSGNGDSKGLVGNTSVTDNASASASISFTPNSAGTYTFKLSGDITDYYTEKTENVDKSITITVTEASAEPAAPETPSTPAAPAPSGKSSNANLTNLVVQPVDFTGFRSGKTSGYTVTVGNDVTEVKIIPTLADSKAKYSISGNKDLKEGTNIVKVTVTAEDGTKKTYQVNVIRQVADGEITPNSIEDTTGLEEGAPVGLSKLEIEGYKLSPEFKIDVYEYTLKLEEPKIKTLEEFKALLTMEATFEEAVIEVLGPEEFDLEGENKIIISISDQDGREIAEYKIILDYSPEVIEEVEDEEIIEDGSKIKNFLIDFIKSKIFLVSLDILLFIIALTFIIKYYKQRRILKENGLIPEDEEEYDEYDENIEYRNTETGDDVLEKDVEDKKEEKKNYINELFEGKQTDFDVSEKDYKKRRNKHGKH